MVLLWCSSPRLLLSVAMERPFSSPIGEEINTIFNWLQGLPLPERELLQTHTCTPTQITTHRHSPGTRCLPERIWEDVCMCVRSNKSFPHLYSGRMQLWDKRVSHSISPSSYSPSLPSVPLSLSLPFVINCCSLSLALWSCPVVSLSAPLSPPRNYTMTPGSHDPADTSEHEQNTLYPHANKCFIFCGLALCRAVTTVAWGFLISGWLKCFFSMIDSLNSWNFF